MRNRARRRVREAVRIRYELLEPGWDLVFVVRAAAAKASYSALDRAVESLLGEAGLVRVDSPCAG